MRTHWVYRSKFNDFLNVYTVPFSETFGYFDVKLWSILKKIEHWTLHIGDPQSQRSGRFTFIILVDFLDNASNLYYFVVGPCITHEIYFHD